MMNGVAVTAEIEDTNNIVLSKRFSFTMRVFLVKRPLELQAIIVAFFKYLELTFKIYADRAYKIIALKIIKRAMKNFKINATFSRSISNITYPAQHNDCTRITRSATLPVIKTLYLNGCTQLMYRSHAIVRMLE
jgi:hypothetical protein